jgi:acyl-coenzyme A synthetase/AMP-(fatty) acid ligase
MGRASSDIIKSGGEKISALDIEREILSHSNIAECAVVGLPHPYWGQSIAAGIFFRCAISLSELMTLSGCSSHRPERSKSFHIT